jgi:hypothetical protein
MIRTIAVFGLVALAACTHPGPAHYGGLSEVGISLVAEKTGCPVNDVRIADRAEVGFSKLQWTATCASTGQAHTCTQERGVMQCLPR